MTATVRPLGPDDHAAWRALRLEALQTYPSAFLTTYAEQLARPPEDERAMLAQGNWCGLFADGGMIGQGAVLRLTHAACQHRAEIGAFYVARAYQGAGLAVPLLEGLVERARSIGVDQLELSVEAGNQQAIRFYERNGFQRFGTQPRAVVLNGVAHDDCFYVRFLGDTQNG